MVGSLLRESRGWRRDVARLSRVLCLALPAVMVATLGNQSPAMAARPAPPRTLAAQSVPSLHGTAVSSRPRPAQLTHGPAAPAPVAVRWPSAGSAAVSLPGSASTAAPLTAGSA